MRFVLEELDPNVLRRALRIASWRRGAVRRWAGSWSSWGSAASSTRFGSRSASILAPVTNCATWSTEQSRSGATAIPAASKYGCCGLLDDSSSCSLGWRPGAVRGMKLYLDVPGIRLRRRLRRGNRLGPDPPADSGTTKRFVPVISREVHPDRLPNSTFRLRSLRCVGRVAAGVVSHGQTVRPDQEQSSSMAARPTPGGSSGSSIASSSPTGLTPGGATSSRRDWCGSSSCRCTSASSQACWSAQSRGSDRRLPQVPWRSRRAPQARCRRRCQGHRGSRSLWRRRAGEHGSARRISDLLSRLDDNVPEIFARLVQRDDFLSLVGASAAAPDWPALRAALAKGALPSILPQLDSRLPPDSERPNGRLDGLRVLWVDDHHESNHAMQRVLALSGADLTLVDDTERMNQILDRDEVDALISDVDREGNPEKGLGAIDARLAMKKKLPPLVVFYVWNVTAARKRRAAAVEAAMVDDPEDLFALLKRRLNQVGIDESSTSTAAPTPTAACASTVSWRGTLAQPRHLRHRLDGARGAADRSARRRPPLLRGRLSRFLQHPLQLLTVATELALQRRAEESVLRR